VEHSGKSEPALFVGVGDSGSNFKRNSMSKPASRAVETLLSSPRPAPKDLPSFVSNIAAKHGRFGTGVESPPAPPLLTSSPGSKQLNEGEAAVIEAHRKALEERQSRMLERLQQHKLKSPRQPGTRESQGPQSP
jgi:hypothetical protein